MTENTPVVQVQSAPKVTNFQSAPHVSVSEFLWDELGTLLDQLEDPGGATPLPRLLKNSNVRTCPFVATRCCGAL